MFPLSSLPTAVAEAQIPRPLNLHTYNLRRDDDSGLVGKARSVVRVRVRRSVVRVRIHETTVRVRVVTGTAHAATIGIIHLIERGTVRAVAPRSRSRSR